MSVSQVTSQSDQQAAAIGLSVLEERLRQDLAWLNLPPKAWVRPVVVDGQEVLDVAVIGGGMMGLVTLAALRKLGVTRVMAFDRAVAGQEGPWLTYARMETLRTSKDAVGPALGVPSLTYRAWFEAQFGAETWATLQFASRPQWMEYLNWYRRVLDLPVTNHTHIVATEICPDGLIALTVIIAGATKTILARRVVLATGIDGLGAPALPKIAHMVPVRFVAHGADVIDMAALRGKRVAVVGAGSSAMDNAASALEAGATSVDLFVRRPTLPVIDKYTGTASYGVTQGHVALPDALKWAVAQIAENHPIPAPRHSVQRVSRHANARFHIASPLLALNHVDDHVEITTPKGRYAVDFIIFATGFSVDLSARPEFAALDGHFKTWADVITDDCGASGLGDMPYLGPHYEFVPKTDADSAISNIYCFNLPACLSHGRITSGVPTMGIGAERLALGIAQSFFVEDGADYLARFRACESTEIQPDDWSDADARTNP